MAVEDGVVLGELLSSFDALRLEEQSSLSEKASIHSILVLYESLRKARTTINVQGSVRNRHMFHMHDGPEQVTRDQDLAQVDWVEPCPWQWGDIEYQKTLQGLDVVKQASDAFSLWAKQVRKEV